MHAFDLSPLYRSTVGFDRLARLFDAAGEADTGSTYPPYNIERVNENDYRITMAVAGFAESDLNVEVKENTLTIKASQDEPEGAKRFLHRGIAGRTFERRFQLADHVIVSGAKLENGLLHVDLVREVPEEKKPRRINIGAGSPKKLQAA